MKQLTTLHMVRTFHRFNRYVFILLTKMRTETKTVPSTWFIFNVQGCTHTSICALYCYRHSSWGTSEFLAKSCFRDWPFVYFSGGFISHLFGDYANINMWKSDHMKAWDSIKEDCGRFVKNKRCQETGKEYFTKRKWSWKMRVTNNLLLEQYLMPDYTLPAHPPPHKQTHTNKKDTLCLVTSAHPNSSPHNPFSNSHHEARTSFLITQLPKNKREFIPYVLKVYINRIKLYLYSTSPRNRYKPKP